MWLDSKAVNCPQKWGNFIHGAVFFLDSGPKGARTISERAPLGAPPSS